jgi:hypothetical protein
MKRHYCSIYRAIIVQYKAPLLFNIKRLYCSISPSRDLGIHPLTFTPILRTAFKKHNPILNAKYVRQPSSTYKTSDSHLITRTVIKHIAPTHRSPKRNDRLPDPSWGRKLSSCQGLGSKGCCDPGILMPLDKLINKAVWALCGLSVHIFSTKETAAKPHFTNMVLSRTVVTTVVTLLCCTQVSKVFMWSYKVIISTFTTVKTLNLI